MPVIRLFVGRPRNLVTWATLASLGLAACAPVLESCRTSASVEEMVAAEAATWRGRAPAPIARNIKVTLATGGEDATPTIHEGIWAWEVSNENLQQALERSLELAGLRAPSAEPAAYRLEASLVGLDSLPESLFSVTVTSTIDYKVSPIGQGRTFQSVVVAKYGTSASESFSGCARYELAGVRAIRENIRSFIDQLVEFYGK
jgi:hypothetical protein